MTTGDDDGLDFAPDERDQREAAGVPDPAPVPPSRPAHDDGVVDVARSTGNRWWLAIAVLVVVIVGGSLLTFYNGRSGSTTVGPGDSLPPFAAPLATAPKLEHDAVNYAAEGDEGEAGRVPACSVANRSVVTSCRLLDEGPLVLMMFATGVDECVRAVDDLNRIRGSYPAVRTLAVAIGGEHGKTATTVRNRRWTLPVAYDRDGGLSARIGAPACPFVLFVAPDGTVRQRLFGSVTADELDRGMRELADERARQAPTATTPRTPSAPGR
ncbi:MAG: hypothetical protein ITG02_13715 [Patulibacter sp.]|nr:hypothetical protein [Patulibacter sp.]